jgi:hypothetical protein
MAWADRRHTAKLAAPLARGPTLMSCRGSRSRVEFRHVSSRTSRARALHDLCFATESGPARLIASASLATPLRCWFGSGAGSEETSASCAHSAAYARMCRQFVSIADLAVATRDG